MSDSKEQREEGIFLGAMQLAAEHRVGYLQQACGLDASLRQRIEARIRAYERSSEDAGEATAAVSTPPKGLLSRLTEQPSDRIGHYKLLEKIGEGGCGVVYMAEQEEPVRRRVALKIIKLGMDTKQVVARFEAERQALALMEHPNIARVYDAGATITGRPYFVMELVRGVKITDYCDQQKLSTGQRLDLFVQVCQAIQHAHQKGIVHRDIKPSNILITEHDGSPMPKVIDFGIAKATNDQPLTDKTLFTAFEQFIGTPAYMSPEQTGMGGLDIDTRSDIYSLGVLLYELLTGKPPFDAEEMQRSALDDILRLIREREPKRPSQRLTILTLQELTTLAQRRQSEPAKLPNLMRGDLDWIVMKTLEKDRKRRYETANGLAVDIQRYLNNEPVVARPPSNLYRLKKMIRRNKFAFAAVGAVFVALLAGFGTSLFLLYKEREALRLAVPAKLAEDFLRQRLIATRRAVTYWNWFPPASVNDHWQARHQHVDHVNALNELARFLNQQGKLSEAEVLLEESLRERKQNQNSSPLDISDAILTLSDIRVEERHYSEAENLLLEGISSLQKSSDRFPETLKEINWKLISLYEKSGRPDRAAEWIANMPINQRPTIPVDGALKYCPNLISMWPCEGYALDSVGTNNGIIFGDVTVTNGIVDKALHFNGTNGWVQIANAPRLLVFSLSAWVRFDSLDSAGSYTNLQFVIFRKNSRINNYEGFSLVKSREDLDSVDRFAFEVTSADGDNAKIQSKIAVETGVFYNVVATFNGAFLRLYVNGIEQSSSYHPYPIDYGNRPMFFGTSGEKWDGHLAGSLDEVSLYDNALSADQVQAIYRFAQHGKHLH